MHIHHLHDFHDHAERYHGNNCDDDVDFCYFYVRLRRHNRGDGGCGKGLTKRVAVVVGDVVRVHCCKHRRLLIVERIRRFRFVGQ